MNYSTYALSMDVSSCGALARNDAIGLFDLPCPQLSRSPQRLLGEKFCTSEQESIRGVLSNRNSLPGLPLRFWQDTATVSP